jgi:ribosome maturation factor RimP
MQFGHESLRGLDRDRVIAAVEPVLRAHGVDPVELIWRNGDGGMVLYLTVERPGTSDPSAGITLDLCAEISRDLSAALDVTDVMPGRYRLEVGSPGVERPLYVERDYVRFAGRQAKLKLKQPLTDGQRVLRGCLKGADAEGKVVIDSDGHEHHLDVSQIETARLAFDWQVARGIRQKDEAPRLKRAGRASPTRDR